MDPSPIGPVVDSIELRKSPYEENLPMYNSEIGRLVKSFETIINLQSNEVNAILQRETQRIQQKKKEEELRRKMEEDRRRLEQEQIRKAEEERLKKEAEQREQQQKLILEQQKKEQEAARKKQEVQDRIQKAKQDKINAEKNKHLLVEKQFNEYKTKIKSIKSDIVEPVNADKELKRHIGIFRRKINPKFGQLSNSSSHLNRLTNDIIEILNEVPNDSRIISFLYNFIAKALISQAETEIIVQAHAALPLAKLASNLLDKYPALNDFLMPRFVKKCPLVIGYACNIDTEEGRIKMGWKRNSAGKWEEPDKYDERVSGICSLFAVLTRLNNPFYPISLSWRMLARIANTPPKLVTNVHFYCLANWWECCGKHFMRRYKNQGMKLLTLLAYEMTEQHKSLPASTRLKILAEEGISENMTCIREMDTV